MKWANTLIFTTALSLAGCAGQVEMRTVAGQSATILTTYRNGVRGFAAGQTALNAANEQRLDELRGQTADREAEIANRRDAWDLAGKEEALRRFAVVSKANADDVLADMEPPVRTAPPAALAYDSSGTDAVLKQLIDLRKPITVEQQLQEVLAAIGTLKLSAGLETAKHDASDTTRQSAGAASKMTVEASRSNQ